MQKAKVPKSCLIITQGVFRQLFFRFTQGSEEMSLGAAPAAKCQSWGRAPWFHCCQCVGPCMHGYGQHEVAPPVEL